MTIRRGPDRKPGPRYANGQLKRKPVAKRERDCVYVMTSHTALLKIGISKSPAHRAAQITCSEGIRVVVAWIGEAETREEAQRVETAVHRTLQEFREHEAGEWYRLPVNEAVRAIQQVAADVGVALSSGEALSQKRGLWSTFHRAQDDFAIYGFGGLTVTS